MNLSGSCDSQFLLSFGWNVGVTQRALGLKPEMGLVKEQNPRQCWPSSSGSITKETIQNEVEYAMG
jgi:hypothetical protein